MFSGILNLTVYFNTSAYVAFIWLSFEKFDGSVKITNGVALIDYVNPQNEVYRSMEDDRH